MKMTRFEFKKPLFSVILFAIFSSSVQAQNDGKDFHNWAATPPMGWNSWDCFGPTVTEAEVKDNADYMSKYLKSYGWDYIVVDVRWYGMDWQNGFAYQL